MRWLIYGHQGWIGSYVCKHLKQSYPDIVQLYPRSRANQIEGVRTDLQELKPDRVLCFIGRTSGPGFNSIDYLEQKGKLTENLRDNLFSPLVLMKLCSEVNLHLTYLGTGCIFSYSQPTDPEFTESSTPNFFGSQYSIVKGVTDQISQLFPNVLNVRIRMPIVEYDCPKNFISKIARYPQICNTLNSMTILPDLIEPLIHSIQEARTGTINLVNPGPTDHVTILELYRKYIDPNHSYKLIQEEEQNGMLLAGRSKNVLKATFEVATARESIERILSSGKF